MLAKSMQRLRSAIARGRHREARFWITLQHLSLNGEQHQLRALVDETGFTNLDQHAAMAAARRASVRSRPIISSVISMGGEIVEPVTATRSG